MQELARTRWIQVVSEVRTDGIVDVESLRIDAGKQRNNTEDRAHNAGKTGIHDDRIGLTK